MSVTAGAIILGTALLGAVGGSVGTTLAYEKIFSSKENKEVVIEQKIANPPRQIIQYYEGQSYTAQPCIYYDANGRMHRYFRENGCY